jgi:hypothetical protein
MEEKRRKREEKEYAKQQKEYEKEQRAQQKEYEREVRSQEKRRSRAGSFNGGIAPYNSSPNMAAYSDPAQLMMSGNFLAASANPMPRQRRGSHNGGSTADALDMERRMREMDINDRSRITRRKSINFAEPEVSRVGRRGSFNYDRDSSRERPGLADQRYGGYPSADVTGVRPTYIPAGADNYPNYRGQLTADDALGGGSFPPGHILAYTGGAGGGQAMPITDRRKSPNYAYSDLPDRRKSPNYAYSDLPDRRKSPNFAYSDLPGGPVGLNDRPRTPNYPYSGGVGRSPQPGFQALDRPRSPNYSYSGVSGPGYVDNPSSIAAQRYGTGQVNQLPPHMPVQQHQAMFPEQFSRMPSFPGQGLLSTFEPFLVAFLDNIGIEMPRLPATLVSRDVDHHDWIRFMTVSVYQFTTQNDTPTHLMKDLTTVWLGTMQHNVSYSGGRAPRKSTLAASLIDSWNSAFFLERRIELVLVKGKTRFSGPGAGRTEPRLSRAIEDSITGDFSDSDSDSLSEIDDPYDDDDLDRSGGSRYGGYNTGFGFYGGSSSGGYRMPGDDRWMSEASIARKRWIERKREERRHEKKMSHRREKAKRERSMRKKYSLYLTSTV